MPIQDPVRLKGLVTALLVAGMLALLALAVLPASNGNSKNSAAATTTATTTTPRGKMTLCHRTGSANHRHYVKINVPTSSVWRHVKHGDVVPSASGACHAHTRARG